MKLSIITILVLYSAYAHAEYKLPSHNWSLNILPKQENKKVISLLSIFTKEDVYTEIKSGKALMKQLVTDSDHNGFKYQDIDIFGYVPRDRHSSVWPSNYKNE
jgi:hypothetical protein